MQKISWKAHEFIFREKTSDWYWILGIVTITVATIAFLLNNPLFGMVILLAGFSLGKYASHKPELHSYELNQKGIVIEKILYPYSTLEGFWIDDSVNPNRLLVKSNKLIMPLLVISLEGLEEDDVRDFLSTKITEEQLHEPLFQKLFEFLGI